MRYAKKPLIFAAVVAVLSAVAYWDEWQTERDEKKEKSANLLLDFDAPNVDKILYRSFSNGAELKVELAKDSEGLWSMTAPLSGMADQSTVENLLKALSEYKYEKVVSEDRSKWAAYGLEEPIRIIRLEMGDASQSLYLGTKAPVGYSNYVRTAASDKAFLGSQHLTTATEKTLRDFRDKSIAADLNEIKVLKLTYQKKNEASIQLVKKDGKYVVVAPVEATADSNEVRDFINAIKKEKATDFVDNPQAELLTAFSKSPFVSVSFEFDDGRKEAVVGVEHGGDFYLKYAGRNQIFKLDSTAQSKFDRSLLSFRDRDIFKFNSEKVTKIRIDGGLYLKSEGKYYDAEDVEKKDVPHVEKLVGDIEFARADAFLSKADSEEMLEKAPKHKIRLWVEGDHRSPLAIEVYADRDSEKVLVVLQGRKEVYRVDKSTFLYVTDASDKSASADGMDLDSDSLE